jgi:methylmalonyl-CoA/ethylmalonyl-CoA epimerase
VKTRALGEPAAEAVVDRLAAHDVDPFTAADEVLAKVGLGKGRRYIDHLGIAVKDLAEGIRAYETLGFAVEAEHDVPTEKVRTAFLPVGESHLELLEPTDPASVIAKFLEKRSGLHHVCVAVPDIQAELDALAARGVELLDKTPRVGAGGRKVAFIHPRSANGVLLELVERKGISR